MRRFPFSHFVAVLALTAVFGVFGLASSLAARNGTAASSAFRGSIAPISPALARQITGVSWHRGCPVGLGDLRAVRATYHGFDGRDRTGMLIVHRDVASKLITVLRRLYADGFPIRRMVPVDAYAGSDYRSIEADNTSAFNCRFVDGTTHWSRARLRPRDRRQPDREPLRDGRGNDLALREPAISPADAVSPGHGG